MDKFKITWKCGDCDVMHDVTLEGNGVMTAVHGTVESIMMTEKADIPKVYQHDGTDWFDVSNEVFTFILEFEIMEDFARILRKRFEGDF